MCGQAIDEAEGKEMLKGMAAECKTKEGATDADVDDMVDKKLPSTKPAKCLNACMMEQFGVVCDRENNANFHSHIRIDL